MAGLLEDDKTHAPAAPPATSADAPAGDPAPAARSCTTCAAPLADGQDWCLECGSAQPGRLGGRPGWRAALTVLGACGVLALGAGAAAYAALSSEAQRVAAAPPPRAAVPAVPPPAPAPAPAPPPAAEIPEVPAPDSGPADVPEAKDPPKAADQPAPASPAPAPSAGGGDDAGADRDAGGDTDSDTRRDTGTPALIDLAADAASTYNPYDEPGAENARPANAVDGKDSTAWEVQAGADGGPVRIGLAVSLEQARTLSRLAFKADTPGFTVEIYGSRASELPADVLDPRWENIDTRTDVGVREEVTLKGKYRHVLLWVTAQPADTKVAIPEIQLFD